MNPGANPLEDNELFIAVRDGSIQRTIAALATGSIGIDQRNAQGVTPLILATIYGHSQIVEILLRKGATVSMGANDGFTALHACAHKGPVAVVKLLIRAGAALEAKMMTTEGHHTPLHAAALRGRSEVVKMLIEAGANPDSRMSSGATALHIAAGAGHLDMMRELLRGKANPLLCQAHPIFGYPSVPLDVAADSGHSDMVHELVQELGIEGCDASNGGRLALCLAAMNQHLDVMAILTGAGVVDGGNALHGAVANGREASVKFLLRQRHQESNSSSVDVAYINARASNGCTLVVWSIQSCFSQAPRIVRLLVDAGADTTSAVRATDSQGEVKFNGTPLAITTSCLREKIVAEGKPATEEHLHRLEAIRRLLLRVEAVHAVSWLWPSDAPFIGHATRSGPKPLLSAPRPMLPILKRRAKRRSVLVATFLRYSVKV